MVDEQNSACPYVPKSYEPGHEGPSTRLGVLVHGVRLSENAMSP